jgi:hypothetical protein
MESSAQSFVRTTADKNQNMLGLAVPSKQPHQLPVTMIQPLALRRSFLEKPKLPMVRCISITVLPGLTQFCFHFDDIPYSSGVNTHFGRHKRRFYIRIGKQFTEYSSAPA